MTKLKTLKIKLIDTIYEHIYKHIYKQEKPNVYLQSIILEDMIKKHFDKKERI
jgi:hypothetical protein